MAQISPCLTYMKPTWAQMVPKYNLDQSQIKSTYSSDVAHSKPIWVPFVLDGHPYMGPSWEANLGSRRYPNATQTNPRPDPRTSQLRPIASPSGPHLVWADIPMWAPAGVPSWGLDGCPHRAHLGLLAGWCLFIYLLLFLRSKALAKKGQADVKLACKHQG